MSARRLPFLLVAAALALLPGRAALAQETKKPDEAKKSDAKKPSPADLEIPPGVAYPVQVSVMVWVNAISKIDENEGSFTAEVDIRLRWNDPRLAFDSKKAGLDRQEWGFDEAPDKLKTIWTPALEVSNMDKGPAFDKQGLIIYATGDVELFRRTNAKYKCPLDFTRFPFDSQALEVELRSPHYGAGQVVFTQTITDRQQSGVKVGTIVPNWTFDRGLGFDVAKRRGWTGRDHSRCVATIRAHRETAQYIFQLFLPFFTIMLFPPLALWVPKAEVMPRANMAFSGLFSLIAFSFSIFIRYPMLGAIDNVITRILVRGYIFMAFVLILIMTVHNPAVTDKFGGKQFWAELKAWTTWSVPILFLGAIIATILYSM